MNNTLYIRHWDADQQNIADGAMSSMGGPAGSMYPIACDPFVLNDGDYIIGYNIYDSVDFVHGITFYTSLGCAYECIGEADTGHRGGKNIVNRGIISYYYAVDEFWYLSGFSGFFGAVIDSLQLQFTLLPSGTNLSTSESDTFMCDRDLTMSPTSHPTNKPSNNPSVNPTMTPSNNPTGAPSSHLREGEVVDAAYTTLSTHDDQDQQNRTENEDIFAKIYILVGFVAFACFILQCFIFCIVYRTKRGEAGRKRHKVRNVDEDDDTL